MREGGGMNAVPHCMSLTRWICLVHIDWGQNCNLSSHLLPCMTEFCSILKNQVEGINSFLNLFHQNTTKFCHTAQQMGRQITVLTRAAFCLGRFSSMFFVSSLYMVRLVRRIGLVRSYWLGSFSSWGYCWFGRIWQSNYTMWWNSPFQVYPTYCQITSPTLYKSCTLYKLSVSENILHNLHDKLPSQAVHTCHLNKIRT